jgi:hypothetical protein
MTQWGLDVLFNPAKRHMDEEKQRLQSTREEVGDASKGNRIDLSTGKVVIRRKAADDDTAADDTDADGTDDDVAAEAADETPAEASEAAAEPAEVAE